MRTAKGLAAILLVGLVLSSCSFVNLRPLSSGEARLTYMEMPDVVREDLLYEVILTVASDEKPEIRRICFRWVAEEKRSASPSLHSFSMSPDSTQGLSHSSWAGPEARLSSDMFCVEPADIRTNVPGKLVVKIRPTHLTPEYNKLEGQAEYVMDGRLRMTNKISTRVLVGQ
ncbi:MAG: hypothetical protein WAW37_02795 [Syntrophobacteraceae bacterium]